MKVENSRDGILIIQTAFLGDVILSIPLIDYLHGQHPDTGLDYLTAPRGANVLETNPYLRELITYDKKGRDRGIWGFYHIVKELRRRKYAAAFVIHRSLRSALLAFCAGIPERTGFANSAGAFFLTCTIAYRCNVHEIERNLSLGGRGGEITSGAFPVIYPTREDETIVNGFYERAGISTRSGIIGAAPGSTWTTKRWLPEKYAALLMRLVKEQGRRIILFGGEEDVRICEEIAREAGEGVFTAAGRFTPRQSVAAMRDIDLLIANDNGAVHLGMAAGIKIAAIFGPTTPALGFAPYGEGRRVIEREMRCRPCGKHGADACPLGHFGCMKDLSVEAVYEAVLPLLEN